MGNIDSQIRDMGNACNDAWNRVDEIAQETGSKFNDCGNDMNKFFQETGNKCNDFGNDMNKFFQETGSKCNDFGNDMNKFFQETGNKCNDFGNDMNKCYQEIGNIIYVVFANVGSKIIYFFMNIDEKSLQNAVLYIAATIRMTSLIGGPLIRAITMIADASTNSTAATDYLKGCPMSGAFCGSKLSKKGVNYATYQSIGNFLAKKLSCSKKNVCMIILDIIGFCIYGIIDTQTAQLISAEN